MPIWKIGGDNETYISCPCSHDAAVSCANAIRILPTGKVCGNGGFWNNRISLLYNQ